LKQFRVRYVREKTDAQPEAASSRSNTRKSKLNRIDMKKKLTLIITCLAMAGALSITLPSVLAQQTNTPAITRRTEPHPAIRHAIQALEAAKKEMQAAAHDFGGHREAALQECDKAIAQLREALNYDKKQGGTVLKASLRGNAGRGLFLGCWRGRRI
jgi:hypothetical protein